MLEKLKISIKTNIFLLLILIFVYSLANIGIRLFFNNLMSFENKEIFIIVRVISYIIIFLFDIVALTFLYSLTFYFFNNKIKIINDFVFIGYFNYLKKIFLTLFFSIMMLLLLRFLFLGLSQLVVRLLWKTFTSSNKYVLKIEIVNNIFKYVYLLMTLYFLPLFFINNKKGIFCFFHSVVCFFKKKVNIFLAFTLLFMIPLNLDYSVLLFENNWILWLKLILAIINTYLSIILFLTITQIVSNDSV